MNERGVLWIFVGLLACGVSAALFWVANVQRNQNVALQSIMCHAEHFIRADKQITPKQRQQGLRFYVNALRAASLPQCPK